MSDARVVHLSVVHRPDDPRVFERECRSLAEAGYEVTYLVPGSVPGPRADGVDLVALPARGRVTRWLDTYEIVRAIRRLRPHVVHVHDPELLALLPALKALAPRLVYDMHEYVAPAVEAKYYIPAIARPYVARATFVGQRRLAALADGVVAVLAEQFEALGPRPALRVALPNYPRLARFEGARPIAELAGDSRLKLIYIGSLTRNRGILTMLDVMRQVGDEAVLYLGGTFPNPQLQREVETLAAGELTGVVRLLGRVPPAAVPAHLASADVVWIPATVTTQYSRPSVPTKLYEGMAVGLAVLASDLPGRGDVVLREGCGVAVPPGPDGHLAGLRELLARRPELAAMGARGRQAVRERYCWEVIEPRLVDFYERLCRGLKR